ncbi:LpxL/LpxP family Kdo(2)-lipid IV(A) lauroyl/palmitoleoyl acyltransferase [Spongorhabdus nitratireducens]
MAQESQPVSSSSNSPYIESGSFELQFLHPRYWALWILIGLMWIIGRLPFPWIARIGRALGRLLMKVGGSRVRTTRTNIQRCFPELSEQEQEALIRCNFETVGIALLEPGIAWFSRESRIPKLGRIEGYEHLSRLMEQGKPVLLNGLHNTCVEMALRLFGTHCGLTGLYRRHNNPLFEYISTKYRTRGRNNLIHRKEVKRLLDCMREGEPSFILADQDFGPKRSLFVDFFGIPAATVASPSDFARQTGATVLMMDYYLDENDQYVIRLHPPLENFPTDSLEADTRRCNEWLECVIREHPEQYLWQHRRFKTRPEGEPAIY